MSWFIRRDLKPWGPYPETEVRRWLESGDLGPLDLIWHEDRREWKPALEWTEFRDARVPAYQLLGTVDEKERVWVVLELRGEKPTTSGPWSYRELRDGLRSGLFKPTDATWVKGMTGWARLKDRPDLPTIISPDPEIPSPA